MGTEKKKNEQAEFIKNFLQKNIGKQINFFNKFLDKDKPNDNDEDRKKEIERLKKTLQRGSPKSEITKMYDFLLQDKEARKLQKYKPLRDDSFEREMLGEETYSQLKEQMVKSKKGF